MLAQMKNVCSSARDACHPDHKRSDGFTLAELLIVVAIILVLVAVAIPVFTGAQDQALTATAQADIRAVKAEAATKYLLDGKTGPVKYSAFVTKSGDLISFGEEPSQEVSSLEEVKGEIKKFREPDPFDKNNKVFIVVEITGTDVGK